MCLHVFTQIRFVNIEPLWASIFPNLELHRQRRLARDVSAFHYWLILPYRQSEVQIVAIHTAKNGYQTTQSEDVDQKLSWFAKIS